MRSKSSIFEINNYKLRISPKGSTLQIAKTAAL
jgi:hypothetical protein